MFPKTRADVGRESSQAHNNAFEGEYHTKNPRAPNAHKLDGKYRTHGKYGYEESHQNLGTRPGISLDTTNMTLPRLHSTVPSEHDDFLALSDDSNISPSMLLMMIPVGESLLMTEISFMDGNGVCSGFVSRRHRIC